jgi:hypothetical protein
MIVWMGTTTLRKTMKAVGRFSREHQKGARPRIRANLPAKQRLDPERRATELKRLHGSSGVPCSLVLDEAWREADDV